MAPHRLRFAYPLARLPERCGRPDAQGQRAKKKPLTEQRFVVTMAMQYLSLTAYIKAKKAPYCTTSRNR
jgi:hypothetical protein